MVPVVSVSLSMVTVVERFPSCPNPLMVLVQAGPGVGAGEGAVGARHQDVCSICVEPDPTVSYFWPGGVVVRLHASCDAVWKQEREA